VGGNARFRRCHRLALVALGVVPNTQESDRNQVCTNCL